MEPVIWIALGAVLGALAVLVWQQHGRAMEARRDWDEEGE